MIRPDEARLGSTMKVFLAALLFAAIAAVGVSVLLNTIQESSSVAFTTGGARVGDPGHNLIGPG
jgi:hypothetical protein